MTKKGRPRLDANDESVSVSLKLTGTQYDDIYRRAQTERVTVPELIRRDLAKQSKQSLK